MKQHPQTGVRDVVVVFIVLGVSGFGRVLIGRFGFSADQIQIQVKLHLLNGRSQAGVGHEAVFFWNVVGL